MLSLKSKIGEAQLAGRPKKYCDPFSKKTSKHPIVVLSVPKILIDNSVFF